MKKIHIGMFLEQNKDKLTTEDWDGAKVALEDVSPDKLVTLLSLKEKSPAVATVFATILGWLGADKFYLGTHKKVLGKDKFYGKLIWQGIKKILITILAVVLDVLTIWTFSNLGGSIPLYNIVPAFTVDGVMYFSTIFVNAAVFQYVSLVAAVILSIVYIASLIKNAREAENLTKITNRHLYRIRNELVPEEQQIIKSHQDWYIG